jgi:hypothetical protein
MHEAWLRVHAALSKNMRLTRRDLKGHLLAKRLVGAARVIVPDGTERCIIFEPAFWKPVEFPYAYLVSGCEKHASEGEAWYFFVRRRELDRLYPVTAASEQRITPAAQPAHDDAQPAHDDVQPAHDDAQPTPQRRKPGPKAGWRLTYAGEAYLFKQRMGRLPSATELAETCADKLEHQPDPRSIQRLLNYLAGE